MDPWVKTQLERKRLYMQKMGIMVEQGKAVQDTTEGLYRDIGRISVAMKSATGDQRYDLALLQVEARLAIIKLEQTWDDHLTSMRGKVGSKYKD